MLVLLPDEAFHDSFYFVGIDWYCWLSVARVVGVIGVYVANALHVLCLVRTPDRVVVHGWYEIPYLDLVAAPTVHTQGLDLGDMGAELAVQRSTSYAEEYTQLVYCKLQLLRIT